MIMDAETINLKPGKLPSDYVGGEKYEKIFLGELIREDGSYYSKLERRSYYAPEERSHPAKTPLHIARWAIQTFTEEDEWVLDPTIGVGTTAVEALRLKRNAAGVEIEFMDLIKKNVSINNPFDKKFIIIHGDARNISKLIPDRTFSLVINNPPYSGDARQTAFSKKTEDGWTDTVVNYDPKYANIAFLKENAEYWGTMLNIYQQCAGMLEPGGRFVVGIKDMMRNRKPFLLPEKFGDLLASIPGMKFEGTVVLKHHPPTMHLNTYEKKFGVPLPLYQTILVFRKETSGELRRLNSRTKSARKK
jgi:DNA modification methylase